MIIEHKINKKPWGAFVNIVEDKDGRRHTVKIIKLLEGQSTSLQSHTQRDEMWFLVEGKAEFQCDGKTITVIPDTMNEGFWVSRTDKHRIVALQDTVVIEVAYGKFFEDDITRYEDQYGRVK